MEPTSSHAVYKNRAAQFASCWQVLTTIIETFIPDLVKCRPRGTTEYKTYCPPLPQRLQQLRLFSHPQKPSKKAFAKREPTQAKISRRGSWGVNCSHCARILVRLKQSATWNWISRLRGLAPRTNEAKTVRPIGRKESGQTPKQRRSH